MTRHDDGFEDARESILEKALERAPFEGWTRIMLRHAAADAGIEQATLNAAFPGGVGDALTYWSEKADAAMVETMKTPAFAARRIRDKVAAAIEARLAILRPHKEAARRAAGVLALPIYAGLGARLAWKSADAIWRGLADTSTDFNFYSKRAILAGVITTTMGRWFSDDTADESKTRAFLAARIGDVMKFEKAKAKLRESGFDLAKPVGWLARLRYPGAARDKQAQEENVDEALRETFPASDPPYWMP